MWEERGREEEVGEDGVEAVGRNGGGGGQGLGEMR